ncbi:MAG: hypothetical protein WD844_03035 [Thermoleophilaceae bacterium]
MLGLTIAGATSQPHRRCRKVAAPDGLRPSDLLGVFFALAIGFLLVASVVTRVVILAAQALPHGRPRI